MSTGAVDNWINVDTFGAIYPFAGAEVLFAILGIAFWIIWHVWQIKKEKAEFDKDIENIQKMGGAGKVLEDEGRRQMEDVIGQ